MSVTFCIFVYALATLHCVSGHLAVVSGSYSGDKPISSIIVNDNQTVARDNKCPPNASSLVGAGVCPFDSMVVLFITKKEHTMGIYRRRSRSERLQGDLL